MLKNTILPFEMVTYDAANCDGDFHALNSDGFPKPCCFLRIINDSDTDITLSFDGETEHDIVLSDSKCEQYFQISSQPIGQLTNFSRGTVIYGAGAAQSAGNIYIIGYYKPHVV